MDMAANKTINNIPNLSCAIILFWIMTYLSILEIRFDILLTTSK